jgi:hypothetical protein
MQRSNDTIRVRTKDMSEKIGREAVFPPQEKNKFLLEIG